jgi:hypothetical protein
MSQSLTGTNGKKSEQESGMELGGGEV